MFITQADLERKLVLHKRWLDGRKSGRRLELTGVNLVRMILTRADLSQAIIHGCTFLECNMDGIVFDNAKITSTTFESCSMKNSRTSKSLFRHCTFESCSLSNSTHNETCFSLSKMDKLDFGGSIFQSVEFFRTIPRECNFSSVSCKNLSYLRLFSFNWIGDDAETFVYLHEEDKVWFKDFVGNLRDFLTKLIDGSLKISTYQKDVLKHIASMLMNYKEDKDDFHYWRKLG